MEAYEYLTYKELQNLKKGARIMVRYEFENHKWFIATFLRHGRAYGTDVMDVAFDHHQIESPGSSRTICTGLNWFPFYWNETKKWRDFRWPTEEELNEALIKGMEVVG